MRVSAKAEYACIAMLELATSYSEPHPLRVKSIADAHQIPQRFLVQILLQMKGAGLVASIRGASGGYQLARSPEEISLADIINAIDRPTMGRTKSESSPRTPAIAAIRTVWKQVDAEEQRFLHEITLAELVRQTQQSNAATYQI